MNVNILIFSEYKSAEQDNLWQFLTEQAHRDKSLPENLTVKTIMDTWTLQMGYPVIDVKLNGDGKATLTQVITDLNSNIKFPEIHLLTQTFILINKYIPVHFALIRF